MALSEEHQVGRRSFDARSAVVRRTHRVVRERAAALQARKRTVRDLVVPFAICSALLLIIATAVWTVADESLGGWEDGLWKRILQFGSESGTSISLLLIWFLPISVITAAVILIRRSRASSAGRPETR